MRRSPFPFVPFLSSYLFNDFLFLFKFVCLWIHRSTNTRPIILAQFDDVCLCVSEWASVELELVFAWGVCRTKNVNIQSDIANLSIILSICYANIPIEFLSFRIPLYIYVSFFTFLYSIENDVRKESTEIKGNLLIYCGKNLQWHSLRKCYK